MTEAITETKIEEEFNLNRYVDDGNEPVYTKEFGSVRVKTPSNQKYFRVNPDPAYEITVRTVRFGDDKDYYLLDPDVVPLISPAQIRRVRLHLAVYVTGTNFILPVGLPKMDGEKWNSYHKSLSKAANMAKKDWVRVEANKETGEYDIYVMKMDVREPPAPPLPFPEIVKLAFEDRIIKSSDHEIVRQLNRSLAVD